MQYLNLQERVVFYPMNRNAATRFAEALLEQRETDGYLEVEILNDSDLLLVAEHLAMNGCDLDIDFNKSRLLVRTGHSQQTDF